MAIRVVPVDHSALPPYTMPDRFRLDIAYFMSVPGEHGIPPLADGEYWVRLDDARRWLDDGVLLLVSPLDSANKTEVELSEDQEAWLEWMVTHGIQHVRLEQTSA